MSKIMSDSKISTSNTTFTSEGSPKQKEFVSKHEEKQFLKNFGLINQKGYSSVFSWVAPIIVATTCSIFFVATSSIGINIYNSCTKFGENDENRDRVKNLQYFFIAMLVLALIFLCSCIGYVIWKGYTIYTGAAFVGLGKQTNQ